MDRPWWRPSSRERLGEVDVLDLRDTAGRFLRLSGCRRLGSDRFQTGLDLDLHVFEPEQVERQFLQLLGSFRAPGLDRANLGGFFDQLPTLFGRGRTKSIG